MSDSNLAWAITQTLLSRRSQHLQSYDVKDWHALRRVNAAFKDAVEGQPLTVHLPQQLSKEGRWCLQQTKLHIAELYCCAGDAFITLALLSEQFRSVHAPLCSVAEGDDEQGSASFLALMSSLYSLRKVRPDLQGGSTFITKIGTKSLNACLMEIIL